MDGEAGQWGESQGSEIRNFRPVLAKMWHVCHVAPPIPMTDMTN